MAFNGRSGSDILYKSALLLSLIILLITSWSAPMSGDEYVHVKQAEKNIKYIASLGMDKGALDTPISRLKHYGQSFDTITTYIAQALNIDDLFKFRHLSNALVAWLTILFASLVAFQISKSKVAAFITVVLFVVSLRFMGHAMNNLKDIPFAFAFIFSFYFLFRFLENLPKISWRDLTFMTLGLAFGISIRIGGLLIFAYYILFAGFYLYFKTISSAWELRKTLSLSLQLASFFVIVFVLGYFSAILIWPWALENPLKNPWISLDLMHKYPTTVRQIFEGRLIWSDQFPCYYSLKYLLISLPIIVLFGFGFGLIKVWKLKENSSVLFSIFMLIAFGFPLFYAATSGANVYGGWRQMLFIYPPLAILSAIGLWSLWDNLKKKQILRFVGIVAAILMLISPIQYFVTYYPYQYTFFNQAAGGIKGAFGNYELDYYFTSLKHGYEYIDDQGLEQGSIVAANFIIPEYYEGKPYLPKLVDYYNRSNSDWDYFIVCNTFLDPYQLKHGIWPPENTIYVEEINGKPILAILKRTSKIDLEGYEYYRRGLYEDARGKLESALSIDPNNESITLTLAGVYMALKNYSNTLHLLESLKNIYPSNEWIKDLKGEIQMELGNTEDAIKLFEENISYNYKFFHSYINLAKAKISLGLNDEAIAHLKSCLRINPFYEPAYKLYGNMLIEKGDIELGKKMLEFTVEGESKYGIK